MTTYYLEGIQCLAVPSSESVPRRVHPTGRLNLEQSAVIADNWAARRDAKPGISKAEALHTVEWPAGNGTVLKVMVYFVV
jgi:hypothetical protein